MGWGVGRVWYGMVWGCGGVGVGAGRISVTGGGGLGYVVV